MKQSGPTRYVIAALVWAPVAQLGLALARADEPAVEAIDYESRVVYAPKVPPRYAAWASFFPGEDGKWYIGFDHWTRPKRPRPQFTPQQWYGLGMPVGYDESQYLMHAVILESSDGLATWQELSREPYRFRHASFSVARTQDKRFVRFIWNLHFSSPTEKANDIFFESSDHGKTWNHPRMPLFYNARFHGYPHRLKKLRDGTLVLCMMLGPKWGPGTDLPHRVSLDLDAINEGMMTLYFSSDHGRTWDGPMSIYGGVTCSETDFVELPDANLLFVNNSELSGPFAGRQMVYRDGRRFTPGPLQRARSGEVPETVCLTKEGILVGCDRPGRYLWSDDLGMTWHDLSGARRSGKVYQPSIQYLPDGRIACVGHNGGDDPVGRDRPLGYSNNIHLETFRLKVNRKTRETKIDIERDYDTEQKRWPNRYTIRLTAGGKPVADKELEVWFVERDKPGYGYQMSYTLSVEKRIASGGTRLSLRTDASGVTHLTMPENLEKNSSQHLTYQLLVRFNADHKDPDYQACQSRMMEFYALQYMPPKMPPLE